MTESRLTSRAEKLQIQLNWEQAMVFVYFTDDEGKPYVLEKPDKRNFLKPKYLTAEELQREIDNCSFAVHCSY